MATTCWLMILASCAISFPNKAQGENAAVQQLEDNLVYVQNIKNENNATVIKLANLNPHINRWFILQIKNNWQYSPPQSGEKSSTTIDPSSKPPPIARDGISTFHLESRFHYSEVKLEDWGLRIINPKYPESEKKCKLWTNEFDIRNIDFDKHLSPYYTICEGSFYIRLTKPSNTKLSLTEWGTELLRNTNFGEDLINSIKPFIVQFSAEEVKKDFIGNLDLNDQKAIQIYAHEMPKIALSNQLSKVVNHNLGISLRDQDSSGGIILGNWYPTKLHKGVYISLFTPESVPQSLLSTFGDRVFPINNSEKDKLAYIAAYDLDMYSINYSLGTEQPGVNSVLASSSKAHQWNQFIVPIGNIPPYALKNSIAVFIGGFKKQHSTIRVGVHKGKTYGYIQNGVELESMSDGLATVYVKKDESLYIDEWPDDLQSKQDLLKEIISARQNGTLILKNGNPTIFVNRWQEGNWSADANGVRTSLRAGICIQKTEHKNFLLYMAFTAATPSSMARVMQAYHCENGMHLDMNAYVYLHNALFKISDKKNLNVEYLNNEMHYPPGTKWHRFILDNNSRDFFYVKKRDDYSTPVAKSNDFPGDHEG